MNLDQKLSVIIQKVHITQFYSLFPYLDIVLKDGDSEDTKKKEDEVLKSLMKSSVIVSGVFVYKSSKIASATPYEQAVRNCALLAFMTDNEVSSEGMLRDFDIPTKLLSKMLSPICNCTNGVWTLKVHSIALRCSQLVTSRCSICE
jgi:hypothetical protein